MRIDSFLMGFGTLSYILLLINTISTLVSKGFVLIFYVDYVHYNYMTHLAIMTLNFVPQFLHVSTCTHSFGICDT